MLLTCVDHSTSDVKWLLGVYVTCFCIFSASSIVVVALSLCQPPTEVADDSRLNTRGKVVAAMCAGFEVVEWNFMSFQFTVLCVDLHLGLVIGVYFRPVVEIRSRVFRRPSNGPTVSISLLVGRRHRTRLSSSAYRSNADLGIGY